MKNFESRDLTDILENNLILKTLYEKMSHRKEIRQPNPEKFIGEPGYSEDSIRQEINQVKKLKTKWAEENTPELNKQKQISDVLEGIIVDQFSGPWLSQKAVGYYTSEADDVLRGVDVIAELHEEDDSHYLGFAIDVTMAKDPAILNQKLAKNWKDIETRNFPEVKYFEDDDENKKRLNPVRVLVAVNPEFTRELIRLEYLNKKDKLGEHKFQAHLILQIKEQLEAYYLYAQSQGDDKLMEKISESLQSFYRIIFKEKEEFLNTHLEEVEQEKDFMKIRDFCSAKIPRAQAA
jgi:hypothetical protein